MSALQGEHSTKGRVYLGQYAKGVIKYKIAVDEKTGNITLKPYVEIPANEHGLWKNVEALKEVTEGIRQAQAGAILDVEKCKKLAKTLIEE